jgi:hypothetical protein
VTRRPHETSHAGVGETAHQRTNDKLTGESYGTGNDDKAWLSRDFHDLTSWGQSEKARFLDLTPRGGASPLVVAR